jgi:fructose-bisphosphate aldolase class I
MESDMDVVRLIETAMEMVGPGRGILAADESTGTIAKRLASIGAENSEDNRRRWRQLLFTTEGFGEFISGVILFDETIRQSADDGRSFVEIIESEDVIPGIKVDKSTNPLASSPDEKITDGLDGLRGRLNEYRELGARFTKWRAVITIGESIPTQYCIDANAHALARYAALSQEADLVPIVEPEVLMDGDHDIEACFDVTEATLNRVFAELDSQGVILEGMVLKPNMVLSGKDASDRASPEEVAEATVTAFMRTVPAAVPGIAFLSGGQSDVEATVNLNAMNELVDRGPWELTFSFGRGLQASPLAVWGGEEANVEAAKEAFYKRAKLTAAARKGEYSPEMED